MARNSTMTAIGQYRKYFVLLGAMIANCVIGVSLYFGNVSTYVYSIHFSRHNLHSFDIDPSWMLPLHLLCGNVGAFILDFIERKIGLRLTTCLGVVFFEAGFFTSYLTVSKSVWAFTLTFAVAGGIGNGLLASCLTIYVAEWFSSNMGLAVGLLKASLAAGGVMMNMAVTSYVNPQNLSPNMIRGELHLFSQSDIIDSVPSSFLVMGAVCAGFQFLGFCLLKEPKVDSPFENSPLLHESRGKDDKPEHGSTSFTTSPEQSPKVSIPSDVSGPQMKTKDSIHQAGEGPSCQSLMTQEELIFTPLKVLKSEKYYILESTVSALGLGLITVANYSKLFGQTWINDDQFLAFVGSISSFCVFIFLVGGGSLVDFIGLKNSLMVHLAASSICLSLWYFTARLSRWLFFIWTMTLYGIHFNQYVLIAVSTLKMFGRQNFATNYGLVQIASLLVYLLSPPVIAFSLSTFGWFWLFFIGACISFAALTLVAIRMRRD